MSIYTRIRVSMQVALKEKDQTTVRTLRTVLAKLKEKSIAKGGKLSEDEELKVLQAAAKQRRESIEMFRKGGRQDLVSAEERELAVIEAYLPKQLDHDQLSKIVASVIEETGATSMRDMGKVMPLVMKEISGRADGKLAQKLVTKKLGEATHPHPDR